MAKPTLAQRARRLQSAEYKAKRPLARRTGICMDCLAAPVDGVKGKALRCAPCRAIARALQSAATHASEAFRLRKNRRRRRRHARLMATDASYRAEYTARRQRETLASSPGRETYLATQRRHNADPARAQAKRDAAIAKYYELHPERPRPVCATCARAIAWQPPGRPPKYHQTPACNPHFASRKKYPGRWWRERVAGGATILELTDELGVSQDIVHVRLRSLGLLDDAHVNAAAAERSRRSGKDAG